MDPALGAFGLAFLAAVIFHQRRERAASRALADEQRAALGQLTEDVTSLREALFSSGVIERRAKPPGPPSPAPPATDEPPTTKPVRSREVPAAPASAPRPVPEDQIQRAMRRFERHAKVSPAVQARWEQRLRALGDQLGLKADDEPSDAQLNRVVRELYEAEADVKDARPAAPPLEDTLASAPSPIPGAEAKPATLRPPPHRPPHPLVDPLAGVEPERPTSSATRTAEAFRRRPTLPGISATPTDDKGSEP